MKPVRRFWRRLMWWATRERDEERLRAEIEEHLAMQTAENLRSGLSPEEARRQAVLKFGAIETMKENYRDQRGLPFVETLVQDTRYTLRRLRNAPAFTATTVLTLALGIGATTAIFTLVYAVLLRSLAVANPDELYRLGREARCCYWGGYSQDKEFSLVSYELYRQLRDNTKGFSELAAFSATQPLFGTRRVGSADAAQSFPGEFVSGNYFRMFGIHAYAGRMLAPEDDQPGAAPVAVMSHRLWEQKYGSDASVIGSIFNLNERPFTVVGITPPGFFGDTLRNNPPDFFVPLNAEPFVDRDTDLYQAANHWLELIGRIRPGAAPGSVEAGMRVELQQWLHSHWGEMTPNDRARFPRQTLFLTAGGAGITGMRAEYQRWLEILMTVTGFVLLIVCANMANLLMVRGMERRRQISLSMALGAPATRVVRQALTESIVLSFLGGAVGLGIAFAGVRLILRFAFPRVAGMAGIPIEASPSIPVLLFALGVSLMAGMAFGIAPAWMATRVDPIEALRGTSRSTARAGSLGRKALVVLQAALALVLLSASGLLTAALDRLEDQDFGFEQERRIVVNIEPRLAGYGQQKLTPLYARLHDSLANLPGVAGVALCVYSPMAGNNWGAEVRVDGHPAPGPNEDNFAFWDRVTGGFLETVGNAIRRGRGITAEDTANSRHVAVVNETFARKFFPHEDPIGKHFGQHEAGLEREYEIVGIAADARYLTFRLDKPIPAFFFLPEAQHDLSPAPDKPDFNPGSHYLRDIVIVARPGANPSYAQLRQAVAAVDPSLPITGVHTLHEQVAGVFRQQRLIARLTTFFGALALVLACVGLYGVTAYNAGCRTSEIGVRMALGASRPDVVRLVVRGAFQLVACGLLLGLPLTVAAGRLLGSQLYGMNPYHPLVIGGAVAALGLSALAAAFLPALRASLASPLESLRAE